jgi:hypothetical protein
MKLPKVVSIQNAHNLMNRSFEAGLAEVCHHTDVGLLAYSALAFGWLTGKYHADPEAKGRITLFPGFGQRYAKPNVREATAEYVRIAGEAGVSPATLALAFVRTRGFTTSVILGATGLDQLNENLDSGEVVLSADVLADRVRAPALSGPGTQIACKPRARSLRPARAQRGLCYADSHWPMRSVAILLSLRRPPRIASIMASNAYSLGSCWMALGTQRCRGENAMPCTVPCASGQT